MTGFPKIDNINVISIPLPDISALRTANVYSLGKGPYTLVDTGPKFPGSFDFLKEEFNKIGLDIADIERIIITHGHIDHYGLAAKIRKAAGHHIDCYIHAEDKWRIAEEAYSMSAWTEDADQYLVMADVPKVKIEKISEGFDRFKLLSDPIDDAIPVEDGEIFEGDGYHLQLIHTPGHSPGSCCYYEKNKKILLSGDHIIGHLTPNPLIEIRREHLRDPDYKSLQKYLQSLDKLAGLDVNYVFPGHGDAVDDLKGIIASYHEHHQERCDLVWKALKKEPRPIYHIIDEVFKHVPEDEVMLAISETFVHLEILIEEGRAELAEPGPPAIYRAL